MNEVSGVELERLCSYIKDDGTVAGYLGVPRREVERARKKLDAKRAKQRMPHNGADITIGGFPQNRDEAEARSGSERLLAATLRLFEREADRLGILPSDVLWFANAGVPLPPCNPQKTSASKRSQGGNT